MNMELLKKKYPRSQARRGYAVAYCISSTLDALIEDLSQQKARLLSQFPDATLFEVSVDEYEIEIHAYHVETDDEWETRLLSLGEKEAKRLLDDEKRKELEERKLLQKLKNKYEKNDN